MKKRLLFVAAIFAATATFAQEGLTSKKGEAYLPEAGDWSIGISATPLFNYVGNLANGTAGQTFGGANWFSGNTGSFPEQTIYGKMFKDEKTAYRGMLRIGFGSEKETEVVELKSRPSDLKRTEFENEAKISSRQITLGFGIEKRRGNTRIQGVYGAQAIIGFGGGSTTNSYGLALGDSSIAVNGSALYNADMDPLSGLYTTRTTEVKQGSTLLVGLQGFIGVEWFFAPKVSLGAEYSWGLSMSNSGATETTTEKWGLDEGELSTNPRHLVTKTTKGPKTSKFGIDTGLSGANISLNFHF